MKEAFTVKPQTEKQNPEQNPDCPNKEYELVFKLFHQNIWAFFRSKKNLH